MLFAFLLNVKIIWKTLLNLLIVSVKHHTAMKFR